MSLEKGETLAGTEAITDDDGIERPVFDIAGKKVIFRNRQETPSFHESGTSYHLIAPGDSQPVELYAEDTETINNGFKKLVQEQDVENAELEVVTTTPEGIIAAAIELSGSDDPGLKELQENLLDRNYDSKTIQYIDTIAAAIFFDDEGKKQQYIDTAGYELVVGALMGDKSAQDILDVRLAGMYKFFSEQRRVVAERVKDLPEHFKEVEAIKPQEVVLVHSTGHPISRAEDGSVTLKSASAFRDDRLPRATLHFTPNGQVTSHYGGNWGVENRLIVTNFADIVDENDKIPTSMSTADTFFSLNPHEGLKLPNVIIVEGSKDTEALIGESEGTITYKESDSYSQEEIDEINTLAKRYGLSHVIGAPGWEPNRLLREVALRQAMAAKGAKKFVTIGAHYAHDETFQNQYTKLAAEIGVTTMLHTYTGDSELESDATREMSNSYRKKATGIGVGIEGHMSFKDDATIQAVRQAVASGYVPARPLAKKESYYSSDDWVF